MFVTVVPNRNSPPAILVRESYREDGKVKSRTLANLSHLPPETIEAVRRSLRGEVLVTLSEAVTIERSLPHGHVAAVLGVARKLGLEQLLGSKRCRERDICLALIVSRVLRPASKLASTAALRVETRVDTLGELLALDGLTVPEVYAALDWLLARQPAIESKLAARHLREGSLVLYDLTSTWMAGRKCLLSKRGYSRDGQKDKPQVVFGVLCDAEGRPLAVEVFEGNTGDPKTVSAQVDKVRQRFGLSRVVLVGDRGMLTEARIREDLRPHEGLDWITALRAPAIRELLEKGALQPELFDVQDLAEITHPDYPGERLVICKNPLLAAERTRKREELLVATETKLRAIVVATQREKRPLRGKDCIAKRVGRTIGRLKMEKHFEVSIGEDSFTFARKPENIAREAALDGFYVVRTSVGPERMASDEVVKNYKSLSRVERFFRSVKTTDLQVRPVFHWNSDRVRAHIFVCMLAGYLTWHLRQQLAPLLFTDHDKVGAMSKRTSPVEKAHVSDAAMEKAALKRTSEDLPALSFDGLLRVLATLTRNTISMPGNSGTFTILAQPTPLQQRALELLGVKL